MVNGKCMLQDRGTNFSKPDPIGDLFQAQKNMYRTNNNNKHIPSKQHRLIVKSV